MTSRKIPESAVENLVSDLEGKANVALTNTPYTTNRILEIPQDIKLELNNGTLTLKAGSKVYALDGSSYTIPSDKTLSYSNAEPHSSWILVKENGEMDDIWTLEKLSTISIGSKWVTFRETNYYLPIGLATHNADGTTKTGWKSIDQVFNGLGYIGSTVFALPGVKTVVPDGRNENGTCKNKAPSTVSSVKTETISRAYTGYMFTNYVSSVIAIHHYICSKTKPTVTETTLWYNPETNLPSQVLSDGTVITPYEEIPIAKFTSDSTGRITSFEPFTVDSVVNSNEFYQLKDKAVTTDTAQTISGSKRFTQPAGGMSIELTADTNQQTIPTTGTLRQLGLYRNTTYTKGDGYTSWLQGVRGSDGWSATELYTRRFLEGDSQEIINYLRVCVTPDGLPVSYTSTPPIGVAGEEIVTSGWFNSKMQVVSALPANPDPNVFYFIPG